MTTLASTRDIEARMSDTEDKENQLCREDRAEEYDQAVRRALTENAYVKKVNSQLSAKLNTLAADPPNAAGRGARHLADDCGDGHSYGV